MRGHPWRLNLIDCGLVVEMGEQDHVNLVKVLGAFIKRDGDLAANLMIDTAKKCHANELDVELFIKGIENITEMDDEEVSANIDQFVVLYYLWLVFTVYSGYDLMINRTF